MSKYNRNISVIDSLAISQMGGGTSSDSIIVSSDECLVYVIDHYFATINTGYARIYIPSVNEELSYENYFSSDSASGGTMYFGVNGRDERVQLCGKIGGFIDYFEGGYISVYNGEPDAKWVQESGYQEAEDVNFLIKIKK